MKLPILILALLVLFLSCKDTEKNDKVADITATVQPHQDKDIITPFFWEGANIYFLLTDRFYNGDSTNDINFERTASTGVLRGFMGGDLNGITQKIKEGYFSNLGVNAIWFSPVAEQIHGKVDEGTGNTYGYHGYWTKDWTALDPNFGSKKDLETLVKTAHKNGIRILLDVVLNHTGPVTEKDPVWPSDWVRTAPPCTYTNYQSTTSCTLVENLPDILTATEKNVKLPDHLLAKWKKEGRLSEELDALNLFFARTGYPRTPSNYIIKWLTDFVHEFGVDGFRVDTAKHVDEKIWSKLYEQASFSFNTWKQKHPNDMLDETPFYMFGEVYGYGISAGREYDFGDRKVDYFNHGFNSLINFELKTDAHKDYETIFTKYDELLHKHLAGKGVLNYLSSHDDSDPFDKERKKGYKAANILFLSPGTAQVYYGDESNRSLTIPDAQGDATLRSFMNWEEIENNKITQDLLQHWQKLGRFRSRHPAIGAGRHQRISQTPYVFSRKFVKDTYKDKVIIGLDLPKGRKSLLVKEYIEDGTKLFDAYSETYIEVKNGTVELDNDYEIALLELAEQQSTHH
ncbi:alpha-amylase [Arenibacter nanhaiticus]|uniref:Alpha-amylase n=1 Tax=Arenibacter nanhaiticus TaxID=558155 RepID=A0A1M6EG94_9FLAO|nr:alpha-amylase family glycosyl hydrolase [Arenibacter nanhaiticus]SHI84318.1 alpha-amylase [Arenibacter nanhaiticus]